MALPKNITTLSQAEKLTLMESIWDSLDKATVPLTIAQRKELDRRILLHERGETTYSSWEEVRERLRSSR
jgi:putative addiction module component (TIGR02574 family)